MITNRWPKNTVTNTLKGVRERILICVTSPSAMQTHQVCAVYAIL